MIYYTDIHTMSAKEPHWNLRYNESMQGGNITEIWDCYLSESPKKLHVMKITTRKDSNDIVNKMTIDLQTKLGKLGIMPEIVDNGIMPARKGDPITFKRRFFVMTKYMTNGSEYIDKLKKCEKYNIIEITSRIRKYYNTVFDLYRKLAENGVCSFDVKNKNIVLNYDRTNLEITDIRIIDIDCALSKVYESVTNITIIRIFVAMVFIQYITDAFTHCETYPTYDCYRNIIQKIDFDYLLDLRFDLIEDSAEYKTGTYIGLFYCYYGICDLVEFGQATNQVELFQSVFDEFVEEFPFINVAKTDEKAVH
jgi:hypothetical protein